MLKQKITVNKINNAKKTTSIRMDQDKERSCEVEDRTFDITKSEKNKE